MASVNRKVVPVVKTHGGAPAKAISNEAMLRRSVLSCLLWEKEFYETGVSIADRITEYANKCSKRFVAELAIEARTIHGLRHVPLLLLVSLIRRKDHNSEPGLSVRNLISKVIRRPDEMTELLALYWKDKKTPLDKQLQRGLADAFVKFDEYSLAKYNRDGAIKLRDVLFLSHAKPKNDAQADLFKRLANNELVTPNTWETRLSAKEDAKKVFTEMLINTLNPDYKGRDNTLGYLALLRNLRNISQAGVDRKLVQDAILLRKGADMVFPFRYTAAARYAPEYEPQIDKALLSCIENQPVLPGRTIILVDVSGSMDRRLSDKSDMTRMDAACTLASIINGDDVRVFSFSERTVEVPYRRGMAGVEAIKRSQRHSGTRLAEAVAYANTLEHDRLIIITDEQATSYNRIPDPVCNAPYMINVASYRNGVGYGSWIHLDGFSEAIIRFISEIEKELSQTEVEIKAI